MDMLPWAITTPSITATVAAFLASLVEFVEALTKAGHLYPADPQDTVCFMYLLFLRGQPVWDLAFWPKGQLIVLRKSVHATEYQGCKKKVSSHFSCFTDSGHGH